MVKSEVGFSGSTSICIIINLSKYCVGLALEWAGPGTIICFCSSGRQFGNDCFAASILIDVGGVDLLIALTLGVLFTVTRSTILGTEITILQLLLLVVYPP